jgi:hypothetical protein
MSPRLGLNPYRDSVQRTQRPPLGLRPIRRARLGQSAFRVEECPGLHHGLDLRDAIQAGPDELLRADVAAADGQGCGHGLQCGEPVVHAMPPAHLMRERHDGRRERKNWTGAGIV